MEKIDDMRNLTLIGCLTLRYFFCTCSQNVASNRTNIRGLHASIAKPALLINFILLIVTFLKFSLKFNHSNFLPISLLKREKKLSIFGNNDYPYSDLKIYRRDTDSFPECSTYRKLLFLHSF